MTPAPHDTDQSFKTVTAGASCRVRADRRRPLQDARLLEHLDYFNIQLGYVLGLDANLGMKLVRSCAGTPERG
jgi:hypothetical protein